MEWAVIINEVFTVVLIPLLGLVAKYFIEFLHAKKDEAKNKIDNNTLKKYIDMLDATITRAVIATNQTYVDALKEQNAFDKEAQANALKKTYDAVMAVLTTDAEEYLNNAIGDLESYIKTAIEATVKDQKKI